MFNIFDKVDEEKGSYWERNHQDNFWSDSSYNNNFQYCRVCVIETKDLNLIDVLYVKAIKIK